MHYNRLQPLESAKYAEQLAQVRQDVEQQLNYGSYWRNQLRYG